MAATDTCFHCALPIPPNCEILVEIGGESRPVCCPGCKAVAELILAAGMQNYYELRDAPEPGLGRPDGDGDEQERRAHAHDPDVGVGHGQSSGSVGPTRKRSAGFAGR